MKKNNKPKKENNDAMKPLNDELGFFDLEPPKIYREGQTRSGQTRQPSSQAKPERKKASPQRKQAPKNRQNGNGKKKRKLKKKFRVAFTAIGLVLLIAIVVSVLSLTVFFKIDTITVNGAKKYTSQQITAVLPIEKEKNLFTIDKKNAAKKLEENLPYIYSVEITRELPSTIVITVKEPENIYYVMNSNDTYTYFDNNFKILEANVKSAPKKGIEVKKIAFKNAVPGKVCKLTNKDLDNDIKIMMQTVSDLKMKKVTAIYSESIVSNYIVYDNRITIKLGETNGIKDKIFTALTAIEKLNDSNPGAEGTLTATNSKQIYFTEKK